MKYDPERELEIYSEELYEYYTMMDEKDFVNRGYIGESNFRSFLYASLVGLYQKYTTIFNRSIEWMKYGISVNEGVGENYREQPLFTQVGLHQALALALWFRDGKNQTDLWKECIALHHASIEQDNPYAENRMPTAQLADLLLRCIQAGKYTQGISAYRAYHGDAPLTPKQLMSEHKLAYAYCLYYVENIYDIKELTAVAKRLLRKKIEADWLNKGRPDIALLWLKTINDAVDNNQTPLQILLQAYEYMPDVKKPQQV